MEESQTARLWQQRTGTQVREKDLCLHPLTYSISESGEGTSPQALPNSQTPAEPSQSDSEKPDTQPSGVKEENIETKDTQESEDGESLPKKMRTETSQQSAEES